MWSARFFQLPISRLLLLPLMARLLAAEMRGAEDAVPRSVLHPASEEEAWNVIRLACANSENLLGEKRLGEVPSQIALCNPALRALAKLSANAKIAEHTVLASVYVNSLAQSAAAGDAASATQTLDYLSGTLEKLIPHYPKEVVYANIHACPKHPDFVSADAALPCTHCGLPLNRRHIPHSFASVKAGERYTRVSATPAAPLEAGQPVKVLLRLTTAEGAPIPVEDLMVTRTQPIHLLIVDTSLQDYHREHPTPTATAGEWEFTFTPSLASSYRVFADVVPVATGVREFAYTDLSGTCASTVSRGPDKFESTVGGLKFSLTFETQNGLPPAPGTAAPLTLTVTDVKSGEPAKDLNPVMSDFVHIAGFHVDYQDVLHLHPAETGSTSQIGFTFQAPRAGFMRLFCQVTVDGQVVYAPFDVNVLE